MAVNKANLYKEAIEMLLQANLEGEQYGYSYSYIIDYRFNPRTQRIITTRKITRWKKIKKEIKFDGSTWMDNNEALMEYLAEQMEMFEYMENTDSKK